MSCSAPFTGTDCSTTYADAVGQPAFWAYRLTYFILGSALAAACLFELKSSATPSLHHQALQQNYQRSVYLRLFAAAVVFCLSAIDPLGYDNIVGVDVWLVLSGVSTFFVLSVCISLFFTVVRSVALVSSKHGTLPYFNMLYSWSQIGMLITWIALPIVQVLVTRGYIVEAIKLIFSSVIFLTWSIGSLAYGLIAVSNLKTSARQVPSNNSVSSIKNAEDVTSDVYYQRLAALRTSNKLLAAGSFLSIIFVAVQTITAISALAAKDEINFDVENDSVPSGYGDLLLAGLFETVKQVFCFLILLGMRYVRVSKQQQTASEQEDEDLAEDIPLSELPDAGRQIKDKDMEDEDSISRTAILEHNAAA